VPVTSLAEFDITFNDGATDAPKPYVYLNLDNLDGLRADTIWAGCCF